MNTRFVACLTAILLLAATPTPPPSPNPLPTVPGGIVNDAINALGELVEQTLDGRTESFRHRDVFIAATCGWEIRNRSISLITCRGTVINPRGYSIKTGDGQKRERSLNLT